MEVIKREIDWLKALINLRVSGIGQENYMLPDEIKEPPVLYEATNYSDFVNNKNTEDRLAILLAICRAERNEVFFPFLVNFRNLEFQSRYGGVVDRDLNRFYPTLSTLFFLLSGDDLERWNEYFLKFSHKNSLFTQNILLLEKFAKNADSHDNDIANYTLRLSDSYLRYFMGGDQPRLDEGSGFPAFLIETNLSFDDVVHAPRVKESLTDIVKYLRNKKKLFAMEGVKEKVKESYVVVFSGLPGTGKTLTAKTIGKELGLPIYCVNLSRLVSKYIGETEKNLEILFDRFDSQECILFFDEADAIFGKRTEVKDSKDRYANQQINYLLQKIETFKGLVILATNVFDIEGLFDKAFQRRIRRHIHFVHPDKEERFLLWKKSLPSSFLFENNLEEELALYYQLTGASISNIVSDVLVEAVHQDLTKISFELIKPFIKMDYSRRNMPYRRATDEDVIKNPSLRYGNIVSIDLNKYEGVGDKQKEFFNRNKR